MKIAPIRLFNKIMVVLITVYSMGTPSLSYSDDAAYSGDGVNVYPLEHTEVQLVSEEIKITEGWNVDVTMNFKNHGAATSIQMGFPFDAYSPDSSYNEDDELGDESQALPRMAYGPHFRAYVNGKELGVVKKKGIKNPALPDINFPIVYTFEVPFQPNETISVHHTYTVGGYSNSLGDKIFKYVLRTGALWEGNIEQIKISASIRSASIPYLDIDLVESKAEKVGDNIILYWDLRNIKPDRDLIITGNRNITISNKSVDHLIYSNKGDLLTASKGKLRYLRNLVYASYGYPFKNPFISAKFYYPSSPFKEDSHFTEKRIIKRHKDYISFLSKVEIMQDKIREALSSTSDNETKIGAPSILAINNEAKVAVGAINSYLVKLSWPDLLPKEYIKINDERWSGIFKNIWGTFGISPNGKYISFRSSKKVVIVDLDQQKILSINDTSDDSSYTYGRPTIFGRYSSNSKVLVTSSAAYDLTTGEALKTFPYDSSRGVRLVRGGENTNLFYRYVHDSNIGRFSVYDLNTFELKTSMTITGFIRDLCISPNGKYLAGRFDNEELRGNQWTILDSFIKIYEISDHGVKLLHQELINRNDYGYLNDAPLTIFSARDDSLFVIKKRQLCRYVINRDGSIDIVEYAVEGHDDDPGYWTFSGFHNITGYGRTWDLETGRKIEPYWEVIYPFDPSKSFPLYDETPEVSFSIE